MTLRLVNTIPGATPDPVVPGKPYQLGLKDTTGSVRLGSLKVSSGSSAIGLDGSLPENSPVLSNLNALVSFVTSEHRQPFTTEEGRAIVGPELTFTKSNNDDNEKCLYEVKFPIKNVASILGYFKFKTKTAWTQFNPDWSNLSNMVGPYFALEHGSFNNAIYGFMRNDGFGGSLVLGGPMQTFSSARPGQIEVAGFDWLSSPNNSVFEIWFFYNTNGYPSPFSPAEVPIVEVWVRRAGIETVPILFATLPVSTLGTFRPNTFPNFRGGASDFATLTFGLAGKSGDVLEMLDWRLFPDYRLSVNEGISLPSIDYDSHPDCLVMFNARDGVFPNAVSPGQWIPATDAPYLRPTASFFFPPGQKTTPYALEITKKATFETNAYQKFEPRLESGVEGAFIEAFMYGSQTAQVADTYGPGLEIDDGTTTYRMVLLETPTFRTIGISKNNFDFTINGYYTPTDPIDWSTPKLIRLALDKSRNMVSLFVDEELVLDVSTAGSFPASAGQGGRVLFGNIVQINSAGFTRFVEVNYSPRYLSYEIVDQLRPDQAPYTWTKTGPSNGSALSTVRFDVAPPNATSFIIDKEDPILVGSSLYYNRLDDFADTKGFFVDFETAFAYYTDATGHAFGAEAAIETGINVFLGNKVLKFRFFECGSFGRHFGLVPGSGSEVDITGQTALGKQFSAPLDWTQRTKYRLVYKAFDSIRLWAVTTLQTPLITIPWRNNIDGFDLPLNASSPSISFGHLEDSTVSVVRWYNIRYGISNGYEVGMSHLYPQGLPPPDFVFGGDIMIRSEFDE